MLKDIARHPSTAKHVCFKLARHFIKDTPPQSLVNKLISRWHVSEGNIKEVMIELINAPESWQESAEKFKTPREFVVSSLRALGREQLGTKQLVGSLQLLGQMPFNAGSPAGYSDEQQDWDGSSALIARIDWTAVMSSKIKANAEKIMNSIYAGSVSELTYKAVIRAESREQSLTLLLMSPEFQRR